MSKNLCKCTSDSSLLEFVCSVNIVIITIIIIIIIIIIINVSKFLEISAHFSCKMANFTENVTA